MEVAMRRHDPRLTHRRAELSQHFLSDGATRALVRRAALPASALVIDAGAGDGAIAAALADAGHRVVAVERDPRLFARLQSRFALLPEVTPRFGDILAFRLPAEPYHVVANVPYAITAALMRKLLHAARPPDSATLIVQREAAEKFAGHPRETAFSLVHKPWFVIEIAGMVPRRAFVPAPRVESVVLRIERRDGPLVPAREARRYRAFVEATIGHGSPQLAPALRRYMTSRQVVRLMRGMGLGRDARTSQITFEQWLTVFRFVEHECLGHDPTRELITARHAVSGGRRRWANL
jgi:23S rRNA (adenine-N6)-dimethyltransferase